MSHSLSASLLCPECTPSALLYNLNVLGINTPHHVLMVAYSGGVDSTVLLDLIASTRADTQAHVCAVHINHNLQNEAQGWQAHCQARCEQLSLPFAAKTVTIEPLPQKSLEAQARHARYDALSCMANDWLNHTQAQTAVVLTAHHQADQAETLLLQLLRGAGGKGLSAMPVLKPLDDCVLQARPLLSTTKEGLMAYARTNKLSWIEDPSNQTVDFDRNYLRQAVLPTMRARFVQADAAMARSAELLAAQQSVIKELITSMGWGLTHTELHTSAFGNMSEALQSEVIRHWLSQHDITMPSKAVMTHLLNLLHTAPDKQGEVAWGKPPNRACVRFYDDALWLVDEFGEFDAGQTIEFDATHGVEWYIGDVKAHITVAMLNELGLKQGHCELIFNQPSTTKVYLSGRNHSTSLKKVFQSMRVPPWRRLYCPLIRVDGIVTHTINIHDCI